MLPARVRLRRAGSRNLARSMLSWCRSSGRSPSSTCRSRKQNANTQMAPILGAVSFLLLIDKLACELTRWGCETGHECIDSMTMSAPTPKAPTLVSLQYDLSSQDLSSQSGGIDSASGVVF